MWRDVRVLIYGQYFIRLLENNVILFMCEMAGINQDTHKKITKKPMRNVPVSPPSVGSENVHLGFFRY